MTMIGVQGLMREGVTAAQHAGAALDDEDFSKETAVESRCSEAFAAVQHFEKTHCLALQVLLALLSWQPQCLCHAEASRPACACD